MKKLIYFLIGFLVINCSSQNEKSVIPKECQELYSDEEIQLLKVLNEYRVSIGLNSLKVNNCVSIECKQHNNDMISTGIISHFGFVERSNEIIKELGVTHVNENIAYNYATPESILNAWLSSTKHKANVEGNFDEVGFSIIKDSNGKKYCTMIFVK